MIHHEDLLRRLHEEGKARTPRRADEQHFGYGRGSLSCVRGVWIAFKGDPYAVHAPRRPSGVGPPRAGWAPAGGSEPLCDLRAAAQRPSWLSGGLLGSPSAEEYG